METVEHIRQLPGLGDGTIHVWGIHVPGIRERIIALHELLSKSEQEKAARFHREGDRQSSIAARGALRVLLSGYTGVPAGEIGFEYSENGKPHLVPPASSRLPAGRGRQDACGTEMGRQGCPPHEVSFNVSHSGEWVVLAIGRNRNIGVDVEMIRREMDVLAIASRYFTPEETAQIENADDLHATFFHFWARKEAYVKATGSALFRELSSFAVPFEDSEKEGWHFRRLEAGSKYAAAVVTDQPVQQLPCYDFSGLV